MSLLDIFRKKKKEPSITDIDMKSLPDDLERFRMENSNSFERPVQVPRREQLPVIEDTNREASPPEKTELILQKLDTIDARLRFIEEKLKNL